jgi:ABC-type lipoprotein release transport system permease subunit
LNPYDPAVLSAAMLALALSALTAALIPALRAGATSPVDALRAE